MIGPLFGGLITQFTNNLNNTFYFSALIFLVLAVFYGSYFIANREKLSKVKTYFKIKKMVIFIAFNKNDHFLINQTYYD